MGTPSFGLPPGSDPGRAGKMRTHGSGWIHKAWERYSAIISGIRAARAHKNIRCEFGALGMVFTRRRAVFHETPMNA